MSDTPAIEADTRTCLRVDSVWRDELALLPKKMLGFHVVDVRRQYILPHPLESDAGAKKLTEARAELSFLELLPGTRQTRSS